MTESSEFAVDLSALIEVLGKNLYSSPGVYVRELLQNAIDAQTVAGRPDAVIDIRTDGREFVLSDSGVGMGTWSPDTERPYPRDRLGSRCGPHRIGRGLD